MIIIIMIRPPFQEAMTLSSKNLWKMTIRKVLLLSPKTLAITNKRTRISRLTKIQIQILVLKLMIRMNRVQMKQVDPIMENTKVETKH